MTTAVIILLGISGFAVAVLLLLAVRQRALVGASRAGKQKLHWHGLTKTVCLVGSAVGGTLMLLGGLLSAILGESALARDVLLAGLAALALTVGVVLVVARRPPRAPRVEEDTASAVDGRPVDGGTHPNERSQPFAAPQMGGVGYPIAGDPGQVASDERREDRQPVIADALTIIGVFQIIGGCVVCAATWPSIRSGDVALELAYVLPLTSLAAGIILGVLFFAASAALTYLHRLTTCCETIAQKLSATDSVRDSPSAE